MSYQSDINDAIAASEALTALVGEGFSWDIADGGTAAPFIVAQTISDSSETTHDGDRSLSFPLVQFSCWAKTKAAAVVLGATFKAEIEGRELDGDSNASLAFAGSSSTWDPQTKLYGEILEYRVSCNSN